MLAASCAPKVEAIPPEEMQSLFYDIVIADACLDRNTHMLRGADSMAVYTEVIERHGYTVEEVRSSIEYYIANIDEYKAIFESIKQRLEEEQEALNAPAEQPEKEILIDKEEHSEAAPSDTIAPAADTSAAAAADTTKPKRKRSRERKLNPDDLKQLEEKLK